MSNSGYTALPTDDSTDATRSDYPPTPAGGHPTESTTTVYRSRLHSSIQKALLAFAFGSVFALGSFLIFRFFFGLEFGFGVEDEVSSGIEKGITITEMSPVQGRPRTGKLNVGYFVNWGIYGRKYPPSLIPAQDLTHILYAFGDIRNNGEVFMSDAWADKDIHYPGDSWNDPGNNLYGNLKQIYLWKKNHRHLKVLLSIGGWTYSPKFHSVVVSRAARMDFVRSSIKILEDYGLDGLDIDYEASFFDLDGNQAEGYVELLRLLREGLDEHAAKKGNGCRFELSIAAPCGSSNYEKLHAREMDKYLDMWNLMAYDYSGSWEKIASHQANVYNGSVNTATAVSWYLNQGIARSKLIIGLPLYGRSFMATSGPGHPFNGIGPGSWEAGSYDYRALPLPGSRVHHDAQAFASWSYDPNKREMVSYDDAIVAKWKAEWIIREGLGGAMWWELSGDKTGEDGEIGRDGMEGGEGKAYVPGKSLVKVVSEAFGRMDESRNWLEYGDSQFENLRKGMA
ncbi:Endochitinase 1 [Tulasnella sp. 330]|nr:Endochitinase 1 [Tulasnella sp. 330]